MSLADPPTLWQQFRNPAEPAPLHERRHVLGRHPWLLARQLGRHCLLQLYIGTGQAGLRKRILVADVAQAVRSCQAGGKGRLACIPVCYNDRSVGVHAGRCYILTGQRGEFGEMLWAHSL